MWWNDCKLKCFVRHHISDDRDAEKIVVGAVQGSRCWSMHSAVRRTARHRDTRWYAGSKLCYGGVLWQPPIHSASDWLHQVKHGTPRSRSRSLRSVQSSNCDARSRNSSQFTLQWTKPAYSRLAWWQVKGNHPYMFDFWLGLCSSRLLYFSFSLRTVNQNPKSYK